MKKVVMYEYGAPEVLKVVSDDIPVPGCDEFLIKMHYAGIAHVDHLMRAGDYPWTKDKLPFSPGIFGSGEVVGKGETAAGFDIGDRVYLRHPVVCGCYSEYKCAPGSCMFRLPENTDMKAASICQMSISAWGMIKESFPDSEGKTLYIKGAAGSVGTAIIQFAPVLGLRVIASASTDRKCDYLRSIGAETVFNYNTEDEKEQIMKNTDGKGVDILMDQLVGPEFSSRFDLLNEFGTILIYNNILGAADTDVTVELTKRFAKSLSVRAFSFHYYDDKPELLNKRVYEVLDLINKGIVIPHIGGEFAINDVVEAHRLLDSGDFTGAIVLKCLE